MAPVRYIRKRMAPRKDLGRLWRGANIVALIALFLLFMGVGAFAAVYQRFRSDLPSIARLEDWRPSLVTQVYSRDGELIAEFAAERREIVPLERVPRAFIDAVRTESGVAYHTAAQDGGTRSYSFGPKQCGSAKLPAATLTV